MPKKINPNEQGVSKQNLAVINLLLAIYKTRLPINNHITNQEQQATNFLIGKDTKAKDTYDLKERGLAIGYKFGEHQLENYPDFTARGDKRSSLEPKVKNLAKIGVSKEVVKIFEQIANPEWGFTFKGVRIDKNGLYFKLDRSQTYNPFRQELEFHVDNNGNITWHYDCTVYTPESLYFHTPSDTMGVSSPEFQSDTYHRTPISISGTVSRSGNLEFSDLKFGGMHYTHGNPNYSLKRLNKRKIYLEQTRIWSGTHHLDYEITSCSMNNLLKYITQTDYEIDTNPLFKVTAKRKRLAK